MRNKSRWTDTITNAAGKTVLIGYNFTGIVSINYKGALDMVLSTAVVLQLFMECQLFVNAVRTAQSQRHVASRCHVPTLVQVVVATPGDESRCM